MEIQIKDFIENEDGSASCTVEMDIKTKEHLINYAFVKMLQNSIDQFEDLFHDMPPS